MSGPRVLGRITCPTCGTAQGMRITHDKNGHPFGYCDATCSQQMRIGGDARRVGLFLGLYPWASGEAPPAPGPAPAPEPAPAPAPAVRKSSNPFDIFMRG